MAGIKTQQKPQRNGEEVKGALDFSLIFEALKSSYDSTRQPIEVDFRKLVDFHSGVDRYSHLIHQYPAKLLLNIPYFFLNTTSILRHKGRILDPFCGSGTVLLESLIAGHQALGADANPLARLISRTKCKPIPKSSLDKTLKFIIDAYEKKLITDLDEPQKIFDWEYWYPKHVRESLSQLISIINSVDCTHTRDFFQSCFSNCSRKLSYADPTVSVPVKINPDRYEGLKKEKILKHIESIECANVIEAFIKQAMSNIKRINTLFDLASVGSLESIHENAQNLNGIANNSIDLIITSPPYAGAQKYIRSSSMGLGWLGLCPNNQLRDLEKLNIGREHYSKSEYYQLLEVPVNSAKNLLSEIYKINPLRAHIAGNYLVEMKQALIECYRVLKEGHRIILVVGNNMVCGKEFETYLYLKEICEQLGFITELELRDNIHSRGLMTKRNKTASIIACEWILVMRK